MFLPLELKVGAYKSVYLPMYTTCQSAYNRGLSWKAVCDISTVSAAPYSYPFCYEFQIFPGMQKSW